MMHILKDMPFADAIGTLLLAAALWTGAHVAVIGPQVLAPRLAEQIYHTQCQAGLDAAWSKAQAAQTARVEAAAAQRRAEMLRKRDMAEALLEQSFGPLAGHLRELGMFDALDAIPLDKEGITLAPSQPLTAASKADYCGCAVTRLLGESLPTGLYSASLRFWTPATIRDLESLSQGPVQLAACPLPASFQSLSE